MRQDARIDSLISRLSLKEKASLLSGRDFWNTKGIKDIIEPIEFSDGPHGLRKQSDANGYHSGNKAVCFPAGCASASSFSRKVLRRIGEGIAAECQAADVGVILGPAVNIKRSPLCGRNFEYYSEDPLLAGELAASFIDGVQSKGIGACIKHFAVNSQEDDRMTQSSEIDERTLREIYLPAFEIAIKKSEPWSVMCSYNRINGIYASSNKVLLRDILRGEWGYSGAVISDWGASADRTEDLKAGMDIEMPGSGGVNDRLVLKALKAGLISEDDIDSAVRDILALYLKVANGRNPAAPDFDADHLIAEEAAAESMVLLKNESMLPLRRGDRIAFIGGFAEKIRYQGGGSSHISSHKVDTILSDAVMYSKGFSAATGLTDEALLADAVRTAEAADYAVLFMGLPEAMETEGIDRKDMKLPPDEEKVLRAVLEVNRNTAVVLFNGSPVEMPWKDDVNAILEAYLAGEGAGKAVLDILFGDAEPSGHLAETFPLRCEDNPSYIYYGGENGRVRYGEGIFVGYRYYDKKKMDVLFPFGHGLSYTEFTYSDLILDKDRFSEGMLKVSVKIRNTGSRPGHAVPQLYVRNPERSSVIRPVRELRAFDKIHLLPREEKTASFLLDMRAFSYFDEDERAFIAPSGIYSVEIGESSRDIRLSCDVEIAGREARKRIDCHTKMEDALSVLGADKLFSSLVRRFSFAGNAEEGALGEGTADLAERSAMSMPLRGLISFSGGLVDDRCVEAMVKGIKRIQNGKSRILNILYISGSALRSVFKALVLKALGCA